MAGATRILGLDVLAEGLKKAGAATASAITPRRGSGGDEGSEAGDGSTNGSMGGPEAAAPSPPSSAAEELDPDAVVTLSVALSQARLC